MTTDTAPGGIGDDFPTPHPYHLRAPRGAQLRRRTTQTLDVARRRLGPIAARRALRQPVTPTEVARPMREAFAELGVTYVKLGQLIASAPSLFGAEVATEFRTLLDDGRPVSFDRVCHEVERALGRPLDAVFATLDPDPIGQASMAVVHRGELLDGTLVAVKVLRPGIERKIAADFVLMGWLLPRIASRIAGAHAEVVPTLLAGLRTQLCEELDLRNEARVMEHFNTLLDEIDLPTVVVPRPYPHLSARRVLTMEWLDGVAIDDVGAVEDFGVDPTPLVADIVKAFFLTAVRYGIFHGDVHAGNLLLLRDGRVAILDWGIVGRLDATNQAHLRSVIGAALGDEAAWQTVIDRALEQVGPVLEQRLGLTPDQQGPFIRAVIEPLFTRPFGEVQLSTLLLGPEELRGDAALEPMADLPPMDPERFDRNMMLLTKQLLYFERYGQMYLSQHSLFDDRAFFSALLAERRPG